MISSIFLIIALLLFLASSVPITSRLNLMSLGLAALAAAFLFSGIHIPLER